MLPKPLRIRALDSCYAAENKCGSVSLCGKKKTGTAELLFTVLKERHSFNMTHLRVDSSECFLEVYVSYRQAMACLCRSQPVKVAVQKDRSHCKKQKICSSVVKCIMVCDLCGLITTHVLLMFVSPWQICSMLWLWNRPNLVSRVFIPFTPRVFFFGVCLLFTSRLNCRIVIVV